MLSSGALCRPSAVGSAALPPHLPCEGLTVVPPLQPGDTITNGCQECTCDSSSLSLSCQPVSCPSAPLCKQPGFVAMPMAAEPGACCPTYNCCESLLVARGACPDTVGEGLEQPSPPSWGSPLWCGPQGIWVPEGKGAPPHQLSLEPMGGCIPDGVPGLGGTKHRGPCALTAFFPPLKPATRATAQRPRTVPRAPSGFRMTRTKSAAPATYAVSVPGSCVGLCGTWGRHGELRLASFLWAMSPAEQAMGTPPGLVWLAGSCVAGGVLCGWAEWCVAGGVL